MSIPRHIFKQYDIRGLVNTEITGELALDIGRAYAEFLSKEVGIGVPLTIVVGGDMRPSSVPYQAALMNGLVERGMRVLDVGLVSTPAFYFAVGHLKAHGGIMVSASHNPAQYNGFKMTRANAVPISGDTGIQEIADMVEGLEGTEGLKGLRGEIQMVEGIPALSAQAEFVHAGSHPIKKMKIVLDSANGMGGTVPRRAVQDDRRRRDEDVLGVRRFVS